jgi:hypothetical protein
MMGTPNEFMTITLRDGTELSGIVPVIFDDQIVVRVSSGERKIDRGMVRRVRRITPGNRQKTMAIGALVGMGVATTAFYALTGEDRSILGTGDRLLIAVFLGLLVGGGAGSGIGALAGSGQGSTVVYDAP